MIRTPVAPMAATRPPVARMAMIRGLLIAVAVLVVATVPAAPADAHTAMLRASPDRNAVAGGSLDVIDLLFLDPVTNASVTVTYNGVPAAGRTTVADGEVITFTLDQPLTQPGRYQVSYEMISFDSDFTTGGYFFTFEPAAEQAGRIEPPGPGGLSSTTLALSGVGLFTLVAVLALFVRRTDHRRRDLMLEVTDGQGAEDPYYQPPQHRQSQHPSSPPKPAVERRQPRT